MNFGEALVIAGLISQREDAASSKIPFLGELPYIGSAFNRKQYTEAETELIVIVTPEKVAPMQSGQLLPGGPGKFTDTPTDRELFFHHLLEVPNYGEECEQCQPQTMGVPGYMPGPTMTKANPETASPLIGPQEKGSAAVPAAAVSKSAGTTSGTKSVPVSHSNSQSTGKPIRPASKQVSGAGLISPTLR